jgi:hypothetical protein
MKFFQKLGNKEKTLYRNIPLVGMFFVFLYVMALYPVQLKAQSSNTQQDTVSKVKKHYPKLATIMSAVVPGAGQAYNKKYWKIPIIYVGLGTLGYLANHNNTRYKDFKKAYSVLYTTNKDSSIALYGTDFNLNGLDYYKNYYRRYRDLYVIFTAGLYLLNIVDANVDAHLFDFDISDDISLRITPSAEQYGMTGPVTGFKINISF